MLKRGATARQSASSPDERRNVGFFPVHQPSSTPFHGIEIMPQKAARGASRKSRGPVVWRGRVRPRRFDRYGHAWRVNEKEPSSARAASSCVVGEGGHTRSIRRLPGFNGLPEFPSGEKTRIPSETIFLLPKRSFCGLIARATKSPAQPAVRKREACPAPYRVISAAKVFPERRRLRCLGSRCH
jgi:hypothetical protein